MTKSKHFIAHPIEKLTSFPETGQFFEFIRDRWWCTDGAGNIFFYRKDYHSPQCNANRKLAEKFSKAKNTPFVGIIYLPIVYVPINPSDYCH